MSSTRIERDSLGEVAVPAEALYGASTQRAIDNFPISGRPIDPAVIRALALIKVGAAQANAALGTLDRERADRIAAAAAEIRDGRHADQFPVDVFQTGSGTSTNMNVNEVIANRCSQMAGRPLGSRDPVHPNDHVNLGQSSNDTFPSAIHIAVAGAITRDLIPALERLEGSLRAKAEAFDDVLKIGRTHLMDAVPVRLGQAFSGYACQLAKAVGRARAAVEPLLELPLGGTAVGTGLNRHPRFPDEVIPWIARETDLPFRRAADPFEAQGARDGLLECHGHLGTIAASLAKIANDLRLMASGPRCGLGEIRLPATQPGSSIMPGKVNPVLCEAVVMAAARVFGNHTTVTTAAAGGQLELNAGMPVIADAVLESVRLLANATDAFRSRCTDGIEADRQRCAELIELSLSMATALVPVVGYDAAAAIAKESVDSGQTVRELCLQRLDQLGIDRATLETTLDPARMTTPAAKEGSGRSS